MLSLFVLLCVVLIKVLLFLLNSSLMWNDKTCTRFGSFEWSWDTANNIDMFTVSTKRIKVSSLVYRAALPKIEYLLVTLGYALILYELLSNTVHVHSDSSSSVFCTWPDSICVYLKLQIKMFFSHLGIPCHIMLKILSFVQSNKHLLWSG